MTLNYSVLKVVKIHQHEKFQAIPFVRSPGNARKPQIWPALLSQNDKNQQTVTQNLSVLKVVKVHQHAQFQAIASMRSPVNAWKPQIWPVSLSQSSAKMSKIYRLWP